MVRILTGGGKNATGKPTTQVVGRPGQGSVARSFRQSVRRLMKTDPADGLLTVGNTEIYKAWRTFASLTLVQAGADNDILFRARQFGAKGNNIRVRYLDAGTGTASLAVSVSGVDITVTLAKAANVISSTAQQVINAVNANTDANKLVKAENAPGNNGTALIAAFVAFTNLTGGTEGEVKKNLPPELAPKPSSPTILGSEEAVPTQVKPSNPSAIEQQRFGDIRVLNRSKNRRLQKR